VLGETRPYREIGKKTTTASLVYTLAFSVCYGSYRWRFFYSFRPLAITGCLPFHSWTKLKSESKLFYDRRSVGQSVLEWSIHLGLMTRYLLFFDNYDCFYGAPSLTRGRVCLLYMLLAVASAVLLGSEALWSHDHILLSQFWDFPFRRLLRLAGSRWRYSTPPPHGFCLESSPVMFRRTVYSFNSTVITFLAVTVLWTVCCRGYWLSIS
jgi:hypothetical protein